MWIKKLLVAAAAFVGVAFGAGEAHAGYVCGMSFVPGSGNNGNEGYVSFNLYTGASCTGGFVGTYIACSGGATSTSCASSLTYRYERHSLAALMQALQRAAAADQRVTASTVSCNGGSGSCFALASFWSD